MSGIQFKSIIGANMSEKKESSTQEKVIKNDNLIKKNERSM